MTNNISIKSSRYLNLYFQVHQPRRLRKFQFFDIGSQASYFDDGLNREIMNRVASKCYLPANNMLLKLIKKYPQIRLTFSISGVALEQLYQYAPHVLDSFRELASSGSVEFLGETYFHSLASVANKDEFMLQIMKHRQQMVQLLGVRPSIFRNTELIYSNDIGKVIYDLGFKGMYLDGIERVLKGQPVNRLFKHPDSNLVLFPRNFKLSDDIAFRYSDQNWNQWPLTSKKFIDWLENTPSEENFISLGLDYETFGEHQKADGGVFQFLQGMISKLAVSENFKFVTPSEVIKLVSPKEVLSAKKAISWADESKDLSAWLGNDLQKDAFDSLNKLYLPVLETQNIQLIQTYRHLQTSDHLYYMSTKTDGDGNVHQYFSPYSSPYEAFMNYMNVVSDLELRIKNFYKLPAKQEVSKKADRFRPQLAVA